MGGWGTGLLVGGALAVGGGIVYALTHEDEIAAVTQPMAIAIHKAEQRGVRMVTELIADIKQPTLDRIAKYNISALVEQYRGDVPWAVAMAIFEHESGFDTTIYNHGVTDPATGRKKYPIAYATPGTSPVEVWAKPGDGGCQFDPHACGLGQILDGIRINLDTKGVTHKPYRYGGVDLPYLNDLFDPEHNIHASLSGAQHNAAAIIAHGVTDPVLLGLLIYAAHANGLGTLTGGKYPGAFDKLKDAGLPLTWVNIVALPWGSAGWWKAYNPLSGVARAMARAPIWAAAESQIKGAPVAAGAGHTVIIPRPAINAQPIIDALLIEAQQAEMARDLVTAADLRAQLAALQGDAA